MKQKNTTYLICEKNWVYYVLITIAGFFGAYTFLLKGNVFCNAQTGNVVLLGTAVGEGNWKHALYYLIPISAYMLGAFVSELLPNPVKHKLSIRWESLLIGIEMAVVVCLGFVPESALVQISQVAINFITSMQYNTFRQMEGEPVATTFATNHIRQLGIGLAREVRHFHEPGRRQGRRSRKHLYMLLWFLAGTVIGAVFCNLWMGRAIWLVLIPFAILLGVMVHEDLHGGKENLERKPLGH